MLSLLPLTEETKNKLLDVLREVVKELSKHDELYATTFKLFFRELGRLLNNSENLDSQDLIDDTCLLMGTISEHLINKEIMYELVDEEDGVELE